MRPWKPICWPLVLILALPCLAAADEREPGAAAKKAPGDPGPMDAERHAAAFLKAFEAGDAARQAELLRGSIDPWLMVDVLLARDKGEAAAALAKITPGKQAEGLPAYVEKRRAEDPAATEAARKVLAQVRRASWAQSRGDMRSLVTIAQQIEGSLDTVVGIQGAYKRATALRLVGRLQQSLATFDDAVRAAEGIGWEVGTILMRIGMGQTKYFLGDYKGAGRTLRAAEKTAQKIGHRALESAAVSNQGNALYGRGQYGRALKRFERAIELKEGLGDELGAARSLANVGTIYLTMGKVSEAMSAIERAMETFERLKSYGEAAMAAGNLGNAYSRLGLVDLALGHYKQALRVMKELGDERGIAQTHLNMASAWARVADAEGDESTRAEHLARAVGNLDQAEPLARKLDAKRMMLFVQSNRAAILETEGKHAEALAASRALLEAASAVNDVGMMINARRAMARSKEALGDVEGAADEAEKAVAAARRNRLNAELAYALTALTRIRLGQGDNQTALRHATEGVQAAEVVMGQLSGEAAAGARSQFANLFDFGALAAARLDEVEEAVRFMESGRAGAMLEQLGGRDALRWAMQKIPEHLRVEEQQLMHIEQGARRAYETALRRRAPPAKRRELGTALDAAVDRVKLVRMRIRREAMREAGLFYPKAATTDEVQDTLADDQAMVVYAPVKGETHAAVLTADDSYLVKLPDYADVEAAMASAAIEDASATPEAGLARLRKALVDPLKLPKEIKEVILSPALDLGYVPWGAVFDIPVALAPSASTHTLLHEEDRAPATGVLAIGDPDYAGASASTRKIYVRGQSLSPLPGSRTEVEAVGTTVLLGASATPVALKKALAKQERWRAAHFACHGLVDRNYPALCALALSQPKDVRDGNGFLTALDVLGMDIQADLAVLSACETGRGKVITGEGLRGLARAFMHAGAPRVICSLWKVDDDATRALMVKFYELWNPKEGKGLPPAVALRKAQQHIKAQEKWKHPYYWGAWVLWGLPR